MRAIVLFSLSVPYSVIEEARMRMKSEADILSQIRHLRHQLDKHRLTRTQAALKTAQQEIDALRAQLDGRPSTTADTTKKGNGG